MLEKCKFILSAIAWGQEKRQQLSNVLPQQSSNKKIIQDNKYPMIQQTVWKSCQGQALWPVIKINEERLLYPDKLLVWFNTINSLSPLILKAFHFLQSSGSTLSIFLTYYYYSNVFVSLPGLGSKPFSHITTCHSAPNFLIFLHSIGPVCSLYLILFGCCIP